MKPKFLIIGSIIVCFIIFSCVLFFFSITHTPTNSPSIPTGSSPTQTQNEITQSPSNPTIQPTTPYGYTATPTIIEDIDTERFINTIKNRPQLTDSDTQAKAKLISTLSDTTETLYQTDEYIVSYIRTPDLFQVEIDTSDTNKAETDAVTWFESQGVSFEGICKFPVMFYLRNDILQNRTSEGLGDISSFAPGC